MAAKRGATRGDRAGFATKAIHAGQVPDPTTGAVMQPIYQISTYRQPGLGAGWTYDYARTINPTRARAASGTWRPSRGASRRAASPRGCRRSPR